MTTNWIPRGLGLVSLCALAGLLHAAGGVLPSPPLDLGDLATWWTKEGPVIALASLVRVAALAGSCWLAAITALDCVAMAVRMRPLQRLTSRVVPAVWRNLVLKPMALSAVAVPQVFVPVATMSTVAAQPIEASAESDDLAEDAIQVGVDGDGDGPRVLEMRQIEPRPPVAVMSLVEPPPEPRSGEAGGDESGDGGNEPGSTGVDAVPDVDSPTAVKAEHEHGARPGVAPGIGPPSQAEVVPPTRVISMIMHAPPSEPGATTSSRSPAQTNATHVVAPGENLWSIASAHLAAESDASVTTAEVAAYWQRLIDENRHSLPDPDNPDLLYRGVELRLPPTDSPS